MPYKNESMLRGGDAPADTMTELCFNPPNGPFDASNVVTGEITPGDEDWIIIELTEGNTYTITVAGRAIDDPATADVDESDETDLEKVETDLADSVLKLLDSKGGLIRQHDDIDAAKGNLLSQLRFTPEAGSGTQKYYISVSGSDANPGAGTDVTGGYTVSVMQAPALAEGAGSDIEGTGGPDKLTGTDNSESIAGLGGNDTLDGRGGDDTLFGGPGNDLLTGGPGGDTLNGGPNLPIESLDNPAVSPDKNNIGGDTISYRLSPMGVTINLVDGAARGGDADGDVLGDDIENVIGSDHNDALTGTNTQVANSLWGLGGNDVLRGRDGIDKLYGGPGDDELDGGDENDVLEGGPGADELSGGRGGDTASYASSAMGVTVRLHSGQAAGGDAEGDTWGDMVDVSYMAPAEDPDDPPVEVQETVPDIIHLVGSRMADILAGDSRNNKIWGGGGDDMLFGGPGGGDDMLYGESGDDMLFGGRGEDELQGGPGNDKLYGGAGQDLVVAGPGSDMIFADRDDITSPRGVHGDNPLPERAPDGTNISTSNDERVALGRMLKNPADQDTLSFARFTDAALVDDGTGITLNLHENVDVTNIDHLIGTAEDDELTGTDGYDEIIEGGDGGDRLRGDPVGASATEDDTAGMRTGDTVSYASSFRGVRVDLGNGTTDPTNGSSARLGHASNDVIDGFENVTGSEFDDDLTARKDDIDGNPANGITGTSILKGLGGNDTLEGSIRNDTLEGGAGADELNGGLTRAGDNPSDETMANTQVNTLSYAGSDAAVTVNLQNVTASGGHAEGDMIETYDLTVGTGDDERDIEVATFRNVTGSMHNDRLTGDMFGNLLAGGVGDDTLRGLTGPDTLVGGPGRDMLDGGEERGEDSNNQVEQAGAAPGAGRVDAAEDWAVYRDAMAGVTVDLDRNTGTAGEAMGDTLRGIELVWGSRHDDTFIAGERADAIHGDGGMDTISYERSKHGVDIVLPYADDARQFTAGDATESPPTMDMFIAATDANVALWRSGPALSATLRPGRVEEDDNDTTTKSYAEGDMLVSVENVTGSRRDDTIAGDGVPNVIRGGVGNDHLVGDSYTPTEATPFTVSNDTLYGGDGDDILGRRLLRDLNNDGDGGDDDEHDAINDDPGNDTMHGGAGNDKLYGGRGNDILNGGPGDDDLQGDYYGNVNANTEGGNSGASTGADVFVFAPGDTGSDIIVDFSSGSDGATATADGTVAITDGSLTADGATGDKIDLRAFNIDGEAALLRLLIQRGDAVVLNLEPHGGGRVTIENMTVQGLTDGRADPTSGEADKHLIHDDQNGMLPGVGEGGTDGVFIL